ncbi:MAG: radical SAM family heme chaperone HemW [Victivallaceae bacterium]|nr:radical SAM family heme chaperone HemW [Victivallaceae bacterium]
MQVIENIYIHVPFCRGKCAYCCFYSAVNADNELQQAYLDRLEMELRSSEFIAPLETLYIGGGTPTLLATEQLQRLFAMLRKYLPLTAGTEISIECNPASITPDKAALTVDFANRISVGIQSFKQQHRDTLGRSVSDDEIALAIELLGHNHFNLDLIYAIPGQRMADWLDDLRQAIARGASHLSCYSLTLEEGTPLAQHSDITIDSDISAAMWEETAILLHSAGLERYEISNYAIPGNECRHNLNIWRGKAYLGFGPAAASFDGVKRWTQPASVADWLQGARAEVDMIAPDARAREVFAMGLRTSDGWNRELWEACALPEPPAWEEMLVLTDSHNFIHEKNQIRLKPSAMLFWDDIASSII